MSAQVDTANIDRFLADPSDYFDFSLTKMVGLSKDHLDQLQLGGLKRRFGQLRGRLPMMDRLADIQNINVIDELNDVLPLLFDHATYKSYPASFLDKHRYAQLTAWLGKLTTLDLSNADVSACRSIDDWMSAISTNTPLDLVHTTGTSGTMSFLPWSKVEWRKHIGQFPVVFMQRFGKASPKPTIPMNIDCIYPYFRRGGLTPIIMCNAIVDIIAGSEERLHAAYPERLSSDMLMLAAKYRNASAKGELERLNISPELMARRESFEAQQKAMPGQVVQFFELMRTRLAGKRVYMSATTHMLFGFAENGLKQGMKKLFAPDSVIVTGGGGKGMVLPDNWEEPVKEFFGVDWISTSYGMTEMAGEFCKCEHGHYHGMPWIIPFMLDPDSNQPLPRRGRVTGRFAFFDLLVETRWGGFITGDEVTLDWDTPCPCGRTTPYFVGKIQRLSERRDEGGEEKLSCAAAPEAYAEALDFLNQDTA